MFATGKRASLVAVLLGALWLCASCPGQKPPDEAGISIDLIPIYSSARQIVDTGTIKLVSPQVDYNLGRGWYQQNLKVSGGGHAAMAVADESVLRYRVFRPGERWLSFNARTQGQFGGPERQQVEVYSGEKLLASLEISGSEDKARLVHIPTAVQKIGDNELTFRFSEVVNNPIFQEGRGKGVEKNYPGVAAYFSNLKICHGDSEGPQLDESRDEDTVFQLVGGGRFLKQMPSSELAYAFDLKENSRLVFSGTVQGQKGLSDEITMSVRSRTDSQPGWRELWNRKFIIRDGALTHRFEAELPLDTATDSRAELRFSAISASRFSHTSVTWNRLRLEVPSGRQEASDNPQRRPVRMAERIENVVFIVLDAARADHFGCYGDGRGITPHIDEFARSAILFRQAVATAPYTPTSISSLFTSLLPERHGVRRDDSVFPEDLVNLPATFNENGYFTLALSGSPFITTKFGLGRDFDSLIYLRKPEYIESMMSTMDMEAVERGIREAAESGKRSFIYAHLLPPHWPYHPPEPFDSRHVVGSESEHKTPWKIRLLLRYGETAAAEQEIANLHRRYMNNLSYADQVTHEILQLLKRHGLYNNSLIIVTSDHGEAFGEHGVLMHRTSVYDQMIMVPLIMRIPGMAPKEVKRQVGLIDLFPTLVELLDLKLEGAAFQGRSIAPLLAGQEPDPVDYYYSRAVGSRLKFSMRGERYKYVYHATREFLFDLQADPGERSNIIDRYPVLAAVLRQRGMLTIAAEAASRGLRVRLDPEERRELRDLGYLQ